MASFESWGLNIACLLLQGLPEKQILHSSLGGDRGPTGDITQKLLKSFFNMRAHCSLTLNKIEDIALNSFRLYGLEIKIKWPIHKDSNYFATDFVSSWSWLPIWVWESFTLLSSTSFSCKSDQLFLRVCVFISCYYSTVVKLWASGQAHRLHWERILYSIFPESCLGSQMLTSQFPFYLRNAQYSYSDHMVSKVHMSLI